MKHIWPEKTEDCQTIVNSDLKLDLHWDETFSVLLQCCTQLLWLRLSSDYISLLLGCRTAVILPATLLICGRLPMVPALAHLGSTLKSVTLWCTIISALFIFLLSIRWAHSFTSALARPLSALFVHYILSNLPLTTYCVASLMYCWSLVPCPSWSVA